ncbi:protein kinase domain-containing protein [Streptosporangium carneum]|uniref:Protein kinase domain-containing protein n=1 Tax=Streptosporangium carneum TaxID=47481 RepID=A0A9W6I8C0_9ACTN|nr:serine/threonine protein kinase [Streptosporangium carneum]GLK13612.1 hypothetical protein GCM10017600_70230 [Streptosporangium carneum]
MGDFNPLLPEDPERVGVYLLVGRLSHDPGQAVYLGRLPDNETLRVIRILPPCPHADPQTREQITNRLHAARRISGAHTAKLIEVGWFDDSPYVVREHVEGRSLRETVEAEGPLAPDALERLAVGTLTALTAIHLAGLAHGALNPDTVLLSAEGPRVCDTALGVAGGEPDYHAPEQVHANLTGGAGPGPGRPADLFAWAATIAYAATGRAPFSGDPQAVLNGSPDLSGLPPALTSLLISCLDKQPQGRPDTKAAMLQLLGDQPAIRITGDNLPQAVPQQPDAAVPQPAAPSGWGAPPLPRESAPSAQAPIVLQVTASGEKRRVGGVPVMLAASVGVVGLLAGLGLWAAGNYTSLNNVEQASANGAANRPLELVEQSQERGQDPTQGGGQGTGQDPQDPEGKVTVPWGTTPDPQVPDVGPLRLATDGPTVEPPVPTLTSFASPPAVVPTVPAPTAAPVVPTAVPTPEASAQASHTPTGKPTGKPSQIPTVEPTPAHTPTPTVTVTVTPTASPSASPTASTGNSPSPSQSRAPASSTPSPTATSAASPAVKPTETPKPTEAAKPTASAKPTEAARPTPAPTRTARPTPTVTVRPTGETPTWPPTSRPTAKPTNEVSAAPVTARPTTQAPTQPPTGRPTPPPQRANPYTPQRVCGAGFYVQRSASFNGGTTYQLYNSSSGTNCVVTMKTVDVGTATSVWATLEVQNGESKTDRGNYEYYAGPVFLSAKGKCVRFTGGGPSGNTGAAWGNCG